MLFSIEQTFLSSPRNAWVEGYMESAAIGMLAGRFAAAEAKGETLPPLPETTALGALLGHITGGHLDAGKGSFQPMNVNFGLFPEIAAPKTLDGKRLRGKERGRARRQAVTARALRDFEDWQNGRSLEAAE